MNRDGGVERLIWRQIRHLISCTMTCVGGTSVKRPPTRCRPTKSGKSEEPAGGGFTPKADGGNDHHTIHDEDQETVCVRFATLFTTPFSAQTYQN